MVNDQLSTVERLASLFGDVEPSVLAEAVAVLEEATDTEGVVEELVADVNSRALALLENLGVEERDRDGVRTALNDFLAEQDAVLREQFVDENGAMQFESLRTTALNLVGPTTVFGLKWDRAEEVLRQSPPVSAMEQFGADTLDDLLDRFGIKQVFAALRFTESREWMHETFATAYDDLTPDDFEERPLEVIVLDEAWVEPARGFVEKKHHNLSHLKELGIVFIIPVDLQGRGMVLRVVGLLLHYLHEVAFYTKLIRHVAEQERFEEALASILRGDVPKAEAHDSAAEWLVIQRYLAKEAPDDPRLGLPHINPEALHYARAGRDYVALGERFEELALDQWDIGAFVAIARDDGPQSLDILDSIMSLVDDKEYWYHQHEALWNELLARFLGEERVEQLMVEHILHGTFSIEDVLSDVRQ